MVLYNPIVVLLHQTHKDTWHPLIFDTKIVDGTPQYQAKGHHRIGFPQREKAIEHVKNVLLPRMPNLRTALQNDIPWDGKNLTISAEIVPDVHKTLGDPFPFSQS